MFLLQLSYQWLGPVSSITSYTIPTFCPVSTSKMHKTKFKLIICSSQQCPLDNYASSIAPPLSLGRLLLFDLAHTLVPGVSTDHSPQVKSSWFTLQTIFHSCFLLCIFTANTLFWALIITVAWVISQVSCFVKHPVEKLEWSWERRAGCSCGSRKRESAKKPDPEEWFGEPVGQNDAHFWGQVIWAVGSEAPKSL